MNLKKVKIIKGDQYKYNILMRVLFKVAVLVSVKSNSRNLANTQNKSVEGFMQFSKSAFLLAISQPGVAANTFWRLE